MVAAGRAAIGQVDIVINIVGGIKAKVLFEPMVTMTEERWDATFALNTKGILHLTKLLAPIMVERQYGKIVNISSITFAGEMGNADYGAAKAAVASLTRTMAIEFAPHVNVNCIAPGTIRTSVLQRMSADELAFYAAKPLLKRLGEPADVANACLFLASDEASYITGEILAVSGGIWPALYLLSSGTIKGWLGLGAKHLGRGLVSEEVKKKGVSFFPGWVNLAPSLSDTFAHQAL